MTQVTLRFEQLPPELRETIADLEPGDELLIEREGAVVARLKPAEKGRGLLAFLEARRNQPPLDQEWEDAVMEAVRAGNTPVEMRTWD
ncbi:MAG: hypothetical protein C0506_02145 [Anaerolinea sp.]|nr:hypothetical protein [Anaerolinea sp.]